MALRELAERALSEHVHFEGVDWLHVLAALEGGLPAGRDPARGHARGEEILDPLIDEYVAFLNECQNTCEYLWSHPGFTKGGNNQTPVPVIIQQDRARLMELRHGSKKKKEDNKEENS